MISERHSNRDWHNWLVYDIGDRCLERHINLYRGVLYDFGAGESPYRDFFLRHVERYVAVDWAENLHATAADLVADLNGPLPVDDAVADTIVALSVLEHLREPRQMLAEACRLLRPGGALVLQVPWQWHVHEEPHDYFRYTPYALDYLLREAGFTDILVEPQTGLFTTLVLKWNYFTRRFVAGPKPVRATLRVLMSVFWYLGQVIAPVLDHLDRRPERETSGFFVTARKP